MPLPKKTRERKLHTFSVILVSSLILVSACLFSAFTLLNEDPELSLQKRAALENGDRVVIVDGINHTCSAMDFVGEASGLLTSAGFHVELFQGENVTIDLLRNIGQYDLLLVRLHSAIHSDGFLYLFSAEVYNESGYADEQVSGAVKEAHAFDEDAPSVFALNAVFLGANNKDGLNGSTIVLMGCNGTGSTYCIQNFVQRGAKAYIAWNGYVTLSHSDLTTLRFLRFFCEEDSSVSSAVEGAMIAVSRDPIYETAMECHAGDR